MLEQGTVIKNGLFFRLENEDRTDFIKNKEFNSLISGDIISYIKTERGVLIKEIIYREPKTTLCISYKDSIRLPLLSEKFTSSLPPNFYKSNRDEVELHLVLVDVKGIHEIEYLGNIKNREIDIEICNKIYLETGDIKYYTNLIKDEKQGNSCYTKEGIIDLRDLYTFNIDPTNSKDFDDAISVDIENNIVYIHIVDITNLLNSEKYKEDLSKNLFTLGYTQYLPEKNLNILPEEYSENKFSLIQGNDKYTITIEIHLEDSKVKKYEIYRSIINIKKRYDYDTALIELNNGNRELDFLDKIIGIEDLTYSKLNIPNRYLKIENHIIKEVNLQYQNRINKIVETFMIVTNKLVTEHLLDENLPQRYHPKSNAKNPELELDLLSSIDLIRKYKIAKYSSIKSGHFGLGLENYTHFTSPIRRAPDVLVHNILGGIVYNNDSLEKLIKYLNEREVLNEKLERYYEICKLLEFIERMNKLDKIYKCKITNITKLGIHIFIEELSWRDFIHIADIDKTIRWTLNNEDELVDMNNATRRLYKDKEIDIKILEIDWFKLAISKYKLSI